MTSPTITVLKVGGAGLVEPASVDRLCRHVRDVVADGRRVVLVHGGGPEISRLHEQLALPTVKHDGLRVTTDEGLEATIMVLCGSVNTRLSAGLAAHGVDALGLTGVDRGLLRAGFLDVEKLGRVGDAPRVDVNRLTGLLDDGCVPVVAPVSLGPDGRPVNVNADTAAQAIAMALGADTLDFLSDVPGVRTSADSKEVAGTLRVSAVTELLEDRDSVVQGGMRPKLASAVEAVRSGVRRVRVGTLQGMAEGRATEVVA